jgi:hypothetical protein
MTITEIIEDLLVSYQQRLGHYPASIILGSLDYYEFADELREKISFPHKTEGVPFQYKGLPVRMTYQPRHIDVEIDFTDGLRLISEVEAAPQQ